MPKDEDADRVIWNADVKLNLDEGYAAFQAFEAITASLISLPDIDVVASIVDGEPVGAKEPKQVSIDYQALVTLVSGWIEYKERSPGVSLGSVFGLEGLRRRGRERGISRIARLDKRVTFAVQVAELVEREGLSKTAAIQKIARESNGAITEDALKAAVQPPDQEKLDAKVAKLKSRIGEDAPKRFP